MYPIQTKIDDQNRGAFVVEEEGEKLAEMVVAIRDKRLIVYHTEVSDKLRGKGVAGKLLEAMVAHARDHNLKIVPLCPYVHAQFERDAPRYDDLWDRSWRTDMH